MKLLGHTVLIEPLDADTQMSASGIIKVNSHKKSTLTFKVIAVGPGGWRRKKGKPDRWVQPEVEVGDCILSRAMLDADIVKHSIDDGSGRLLIHADGILMKWRQ